MSHRKSLKVCENLSRRDQHGVKKEYNQPKLLLLAPLPLVYPNISKDPCFSLCYSLFSEICLSIEREARM